MHVDLGQALFGYDRGHRLVSSSVRLDRDAQWILRAVTDMKFGPDTTSCLTVLPLPAAGYHAFIRTWPTAPTFRPGSVWSHVLLLPADAIAYVADYQFIDDTFHRPALERPEDLPSHTPVYAQPLRVEVTGPRRPIDGPDDLLDQLVTATYGTDEPAEIRTQDLATADRALLGIMGQQWPSLRATFAARTRHRLSASSVAQFQVQVVERSSGKVTPTSASRTTWSTALVEDLRSPKRELRLFLHTYGHGVTSRASVPVLTSLYLSTSAGNVDDTSALVENSYPTAGSMAALKHDLFGPAEQTVGRLGGWPHSEPARLRALFRVKPSTVAYRDLSVRRRLAALAGWSPEVVAEIAELIDWTGLRGPARDEVVGGLTSGGGASLLVSIVAGHPNLAAELLAGRPDTWATSEAWDLLGPEVVAGLVLAAEPAVRGEVFRGLLIGGLIEPAQLLCERDPYLWWAALDPDHVAAIAANEQAIATARVVLHHVGVARVGRFEYPFTSSDQALVLSRTSDPDDRLWRAAPAGMWLDAVKAATIAGELTGDHLGLLVMALGAAEGTGSAEPRRRAWSTIFAPLHELLDGTGAPTGSERTLRDTLPSGPSWDWCGRLRHGLARAAVEDKWSDEDVAAVAAGADHFATDVLSRVTQMRDHHDGSIVDALRNLLGF